MPEHLRSLIVILVIGWTVFLLFRGALAPLTSRLDYNRRILLWTLLTASGFLLANFWVFSLLMLVALLLANTRDPNPAATILLLLFALPVAHIVVPGFAGINYLFLLTPQRLIMIVALLLLLGRPRDPRSAPLGSLTPDRWLLAYLLLTVALFLRETSFTDTLRQLLYAVIDVLVPYYLVSRLLDSPARLREAASYLLLGILVLAAIALFEFGKQWLLYRPFIGHAGLEGISEYLRRSGYLRALASAGQPIALGCLISGAIGLLLYLGPRFANGRDRVLALGLLGGGLFATLSRGPWLGAVAIAMLYFLTGPSGLRRVLLLAIAGVIAIGLLSVTPGGDRIISLLPIIGEDEQGTISYRQRLFDNASIVIARNPWLGSVNYLQTPEMESMRQGQGIIDLVNSYLQIALQAGLIGLALYLAFFLSVLFGILRMLRRLPQQDTDQIHLGRALFATLSGLLLTIATVSQISVIPYLCWLLAGIGVAYLQTAERDTGYREQAPPPRTLGAPRPPPQGPG